MSHPFRLSKDKALALVIELAPGYTETLLYLQGPGGWLRLPQEFLEHRARLRIEGYPELYNNEIALGIALMYALIGKEGFARWSAEINAMPLADQQALIDRLADESDTIDITQFLPPETDEDQRLRHIAFEALSEEGKKEAIEREQYFWGYAYAQFYNALSILVHGEKLTSLVPKAISGDEVAYCKAIQIDRTILTNHPFFSQRRLKAMECGEADFLSRIAYREQNPTLRGKIRYPALYMVFALLESLRWLDDVSHSEILDICDQAKLERFQERIEDVNYVTKRLAGYRELQKTGNVSMQ